MARISKAVDRILALQRAHLHAIASKQAPVAPGVDREGAPPIEELAVLEQQALRRFTPRRNPCPKVAEFDQRTAVIDARKQKLTERLADLHIKLENSPALDAERLARWIEAGERGARPKSSKPSIEEKIDEAVAEVAALDVQLTRVLGENGEKERYVTKHRDRLVKQADDEAERTLARALELVAELEDIRQALAEHRAAAVWACVFPESAAGQMPPVHQLAGGNVKAHHRAGLNQPLEAKRAFDLLRDDVALVRHNATPAQRALMDGTDPRHGGALWADSDEGREAERAEK
ncbi:MAG TPA: hypothetical protein VHR88_10080, partial [Solirubrobacteraceae bacterium]|nr:hypothetical protein [Solirubrobacteraceae bacterium]